MPTGSRIRTDNVFGTLTDNPLTNGATTMNSAGLANLAAVSGNHAVIVLDPLRSAGAPEIVIVTAHTGSATSATITRGAYGTSSRQHAQGTLWVHAPTREDFIQILTSSTRPSDPHRGQVIFETDTGRWVARSVADTWLPSPHNPPACRAIRTTTQSLTDATITTVLFDSESFDTDSMHSTSVNTDRVTFNTAGVYVVNFNFSIAVSNDYSQIFAAIILNGATRLATYSCSPAAFNISQENSLTAVYKMAAGDFVTAQVYQDNTANAARNLLATPLAPNLSAVWIGVG